MFRRGNTLPARPTIPNKDEILEDLTNASPDDVIYEYREVNVSNDGVKRPIKTHEDYELEEGNKSVSYLKIDSFLDKINCLRNNLVKLEQQKSNLKLLEENLLQEMGHIKKDLSTNS